MVNNNSGYLLNNRYRLVDQIGEGGMANVYLGVDTILNRNVAIKVLRGDLSHDDTFVKRFNREALAATALEHPNLVQVFDVGEEQGYHYIVMEYIEGKTLKQLIKQHGPLSVGETIDVMEQLVSAVEHAHSRHVIHRDIKPQNVIVRNDGTVKLADFGIAIAQNATQLTQTNSIMGSVHYLAPEIAKGQQASAQSDIYSLGIVMYELLAGDVPFSGDAAVNIALMHMEEKMPSIRQVAGGDVNQAVENIITKATAKNQYSRYASAHEMLIDLVDSQYRNDEAVYELENDEVNAIQDNNNTTIIMDREDIKAKKKMATKTKLIIAGVIALLLLAAGIIAMNQQPSGPTMPNLIGRTEKVAREDLEKEKIVEDGEEGYKIEIKKDFNSEYPKGEIYETDPTGGSKLEKNQTITLMISKGKKATNVTIPSFEGKYQNDYEKELRALGLNVTSTEEESASDEYLVLRTHPASNTSVRKGTTVTIVYATKPKEKEVTVPGVGGLEFGAARDAIQKEGLIVSTSTCVGDGSTFVKSQFPTEGTKVKEGKKVTLRCEVKKEDKGNENPDNPSNPKDSTPE